MMVNDSNGHVNNQSRARQAFFTHTEVIGWCFAFGIVDMLIVMSNTLAIVVFTRSKLLRKRTNYFLLCLAIADMMVGTISLPIFVHTLVLYTRGEELDSAWINVLHRLLDIFFRICFNLCTNNYCIGTFILSGSTKLASNYTKLSVFYLDKHDLDSGGRACVCKSAREREDDLKQHILVPYACIFLHLRGGDLLGLYRHLVQG